MLLVYVGEDSCAHSTAAHILQGFRHPCLRGITEHRDDVPRPVKNWVPTVACCPVEHDNPSRVGVQNLFPVRQIEPPALIFTHVVQGDGK